MIPASREGLQALELARELRFGDPEGCLVAAQQAKALLEGDAFHVGALWEARFLELVSLGRQGYRRQALYGFAQVRDHWVAAGNLEGVALVDLASGTNYLRLGDLEAALEQLTKSEYCLRELGHEELSSCLSALALTQEALGNLDAAEQMLTAALELDQLPVRELVGTHVNRASIRSRARDVVGARDDLTALDQYLPRLRAEGTPVVGWVRFEASMAEARCLLSEGRVDEAREHVVALEDRIEEAQVSTRASFYRLAARAWASPTVPDHRRSVGLLERGVCWARAEDSAQLEQELLVELARQRRRMGDLEGAWAARDQADLLQKRLRQDELNGRLAALQVRLENSALQQRKRELEDANLELERVSRDQALLIQVLGHDLRSPLATMLAAADLMAAGRLDGAQVGRLGMRLSDASRRMTHLLDALTSDRAVRTGQRYTRAEEVDLAASLGPVLGAWRRRAEAKGIAVEGEVPLCTVLGDRVALGQVFDNLLSNAVKFTPHDGSIHVSFDALSPLQLSIEDSGPGIPPEEVEQVFHRFTRGSAAPTGGESSTGLGLALVRHLVRAMGGEVHCTASELGGAKMTVTLEV